MLRQLVYRVRPNYAVGVPHATGPAQPLTVWPNPFRSSVSLALPGVGTLQSVEVIDLAGRLVRRWNTPGTGLTWDGRDSGGRSLPAGVYLVRAKSSAGEKLLSRIVKVNG